MILTCPQCTVHYKIEAESFPVAGSKVRCKNCGHTWFKKPDTHITPSPNDITPTVEKSEISGRTTPQVTHKKRRIFVYAMAVLLVGGSVSGYVFLPELTQLDVLKPYFGTLDDQTVQQINTTTPYAITQARYSFEERPEGRALIVQGRVRNTSTITHTLSDIHAKLFDATGKVVYAWDMPLDTFTLSAGEEKEFVGRLMYPPETATQVTIEISPED